MQEKINVSIDEGIVREIDRLAEEYNLSRSRMVQNLLSASLVDVSLLKKLGFMSLSESIIKVQREWRRVSKTA